MFYILVINWRGHYVIIYQQLRLVKVPLILGAVINQVLFSLETSEIWLKAALCEWVFPVGLRCPFIIVLNENLGTRHKWQLRKLF